MGIRLLSGREFESRDLNASEPVPALVNLVFAERFFPGLNPIGNTFEQIGDDRPIRQEIVGVVANSRYNNLRETIEPAIYSPLHDLNGAMIELRTEGDSGTFAGTLRRAIEAGSPGLRVRSSILQSTRMEDTLVRERLLAWLGGFFGLAAVLLLAVGLHGVVGYFVTRRTKEIGIRVALGAKRQEIVSLVISEIAVLVCAGIAVGAASGIALSQYAAFLLFEVKPTEVTSLTLPLAVIAFTCVVAALRPTIRAVRVGSDDRVALRVKDQCGARLAYQ